MTSGTHITLRDSLSEFRPPPDEIVMRCATCGKEKPNDLAWPRSATCCGESATCCGESRWVGSVALSETPEGVVAHGDVRYGIEVPDA